MVIKNYLIRVLGIVLTLAILGSFLVTAVPTFATSNQTWSRINILSTTNNIMIGGSGNWVIDGAVDGKTFFAVTGNNSNSFMYKTTDAGLTWVITGIGTGLSTVVGINNVVISSSYATDGFGNW